MSEFTFTEAPPGAQKKSNPGESALWVGSGWNWKWGSFCSGPEGGGGGGGAREPAEVSQWGKELVSA